MAPPATREPPASQSALKFDMDLKQNKLTNEVSELDNRKKCKSTENKDEKR